MKKCLLTLFICTILVGTAQAKEGFYLAPKIGINFSNFAGVKAMDYSPGFNVGLAAGLDFGMLGVEASAMYSMVVADLTSHTRVKSNYISVPVVGRLYFLDLVYISAGPQFDFLISSDIKNIGKGDNSSITLSSAKKALVSGVVGCGVQLERLGLGFTYNIGFSNVFTNMFDQFETGSHNPRNQNLALTASWRF